MAYGRISETFWHDDKIRALSGSARTFMLYLMSCPHGNRVGLFVLDPLYAAADVQWSVEAVKEALGELRDTGRIGWDIERRVVFVSNYLRHNTLINGSVVKGAINDLRAVPDTGLFADLLEAVEDAQRGAEGPCLPHYRELEAVVRHRVARISGPPPANGVDTQQSHNAPHNATANREGKVTGVSQTHSRISSPSPPSPSRAVPQAGTPGAHHRDEVFGTLDDVTVAAIKGLYGWGGSEGMDERVWGGSKTLADRRRCLSIAVQRLQGEDMAYNGRLFRRILETVIAEQAATKSVAPAAWESDAEYRARMQAEAS